MADPHTPKAEPIPQTRGLAYREAGGQQRTTGGRLPSLTTGEVERLKYLAKNSNLTIEDLAHRYGISKNLARRAIDGTGYVTRDMALLNRRR